MQRDVLSEYLTTFLKADDFNDYCPNGLQVEGRREVRNVVTGVSASVELFERAVDEKADTVLVHHGIIWDGQRQLYRGGYRERVRLLLENDINLYAYHLPLDAHPQVGNNAQLSMLLGLRATRPFGDQDVGVCGELDDMPQDAFFEKVGQVVERKPLIFPYGPDTINRVGIMSGAAQKEVALAVGRGFDAFVTGEVGEMTLHYVKEERIHFVSAGHYATEKYGVKALGNHIRERFGLAVTFIDLFNPV